MMIEKWTNIFATNSTYMPFDCKTNFNRCNPGLIFFLFLNIGCSYTPEEENFTPVYNAYLGARLDIYSNSVLELFTPTTFSFSVSSKNKRYYHAQIYMDGKHIQSLSSSNGEFSFSLDPIDFENGTRLLKLEITYPSTSGSLADKLDQEVLTVTKEFQIIVDNTPPEPHAKPTVKIEDGKLMVSWNATTEKAVKSYTIEVKYFDGDKVIDRDSILTFDLNTTKLQDHFYAGGKVSYQVNLKGHNFYIRGIPEFFECVPIDISYYNNPGDQGFSFSQSLLYGQSSIELEVTVAGQILKFSVASAGQIQIPNVPFGAEIPYEFRLRTKSNSHQSRPFYRIKRIANNGIKIPRFSYVQYASSLNAYYLSSYVSGAVKIYKLDASSMDVIDSLVYPTPALSGAGPLIFSRNNAHNYFIADRKFKKLDLNTLEIIGDVDLAPVINNQTFIWEHWVTLTDNNLLAFGTGNDRAYVIDMSTKTVLWTQTNYRAPSLSADGEYLFFDKALYKGGPSAAWNQLVGKISTVEEGMIFRKPETNELFAKVNTLVYKYNATSTPSSSGNLIAVTTPIEGAFFTKYYYDHHSDTFWGAASTATNYVFRVYNAVDFSKVAEIPVPSGTNLNPHYINGIYFHSNGYYQK